MNVRLIGALQVLIATGLSTGAIWAAGWARPEPGVVTDDTGSRVVWVQPGGPSWNDGLRRGQLVVAVESGLDPTRWAIVTSDGNVEFGTSYERHELVLRDTLPTALLAALAAALALLAVRRIVVATALAALSIVLASSTAAAAGLELLSSFALVAALIAPLVWLTLWGIHSRNVRLLAGIVGLGITSAWLVARHAVPELFGPIEVARQGAMAGGSFWVLVLLTDWRRWRRWLVSLGSTRAADILAAGVMVALTLFMALVFELSALVLIPVVVVAVLLYPAFRRGAGRAVDHVVLGDVRDRARITAVEEERGRIARDLHDAPLQQVAAVIRQLDGRTDAHEETKLLRSVADHLRRITIELRPPILEDLGLSAAIAYIAEQAAISAPAMKVRLEIRPESTLTDMRPPADVELAVFRIVQEAVDNAVRHAEAAMLAISATIAQAEITASVVDDGKGITESAAREATLAGHFGLASMGQRAALIGADLEIEAVRPHGTRVYVIWGARR